jgi:hypothetical protein
MNSPTITHISKITVIESRDSMINQHAFHLEHLKIFAQAFVHVTTQQLYSTM